MLCCHPFLLLHEVLVIAQFYSSLRQTVSKSGAFAGVRTFSRSGLAAAVLLTSRYLLIYIVNLCNVLDLVVLFRHVLAMRVQIANMNIQDVALKEVHAFHVLNIILRVVLRPTSTALLLCE